MRPIAANMERRHQAAVHVVTCNRSVFAALCRWRSGGRKVSIGGSIAGACVQGGEHASEWWRTL
eukprot:SAG22_NODE_16253_length_329_cov_2.021739_1_plen_63_part_10